MTNKKNFYTEIIKAAEDGKIEAIAIGELRWPDKNKPDYISAIGKLLPPILAADFLDYVFDSNLGIIDCHPIYVWTENRVLFVEVYDGQTRITSVPRHPAECVPSYVGKVD